MPPAVRLVFVVHDHQPVGNFDDVFARTYADSYLPFLDLLERHPAIRIAIHTSGPLAEWLDRWRPEYLDRLAARVAAGQIEIVGGGFYEPILALLTPRDRTGQIGSYRDWLESRLEAPVRGMWVAERVWDPGMVADIAAAGMTWTILDDTHFKAAGLRDDELDRLWLTEGDGRTLAVFPVSERLRYLIPFAPPEATIDHLRFMASRRPGGLAVFADDGEKFGAWPETHRTCFTEGWLEKFFTLLEANADWIRMSLPAEVLAEEPPAGTVWLPECSYREMTEWVLPPELQLACIEARKAAASDPRLAGAAAFLRGGSWRNFRRRYPEANEMYARMMAVSTRLARLRSAGTAAAGPLAEAERALYRGQCNCAYWHGAFGGIYLPHLRNAVFAELIAADAACDRSEDRTAPWLDTSVADFDFDGREEIRIGTDALEAWVAPGRGGIIYELDLRTTRHNLLATLDRRPEAYHAQVLAGPGAARSIVDESQPARFKHEGLERMVRYDVARRKSLVDHFWDLDATGVGVADGEAQERGDFATGAYAATLQHAVDHVTLTLARPGNAWGIHFRLEKTITVARGGHALDIAYVLSGLPADFRQHLAVEFIFAGMPAEAEGRFFHDGRGTSLGDLGDRLDLPGALRLGLVDRWLGIDVLLECTVPSAGEPGGVWTFPIRSVSQSEGGFELVHQSVVVMPHWIVTPDAAGRWSMTMRLAIEQRADGGGRAGSSSPKG
ncbi:MAG: alpha-amylase/4-alpha-glucanotransferase domain-containing protein [Planctomycetia bacterium]